MKHSEIPRNNESRQKTPSIQIRLFHIWIFSTLGRPLAYSNNLSSDDIHRFTSIYENHALGLTIITVNAICGYIYLCATFVDAQKPTLPQSFYLDFHFKFAVYFRNDWFVHVKSAWEHCSSSHKCHCDFKHSECTEISFYMMTTKL